MIQRLALVAALAVPALSQSHEILLESGLPLAGFGIVGGFSNAAVNDAGTWAADVANRTGGAGVVVDGVLVHANGTALPLGGQYNGAIRLFLDGVGRVAYTTWPQISNMTEIALLLDGAEILRSGDATGVPGTTWGRFFLTGLSDTGRAYIRGTVLDLATNELLQAFGYVEVNASGTVIARELVALQGQPLPGGLGNFVGPVRSVAVASNGSVIWVGKRDSGTIQDDDFILLDNTVLAIENEPSPVPGEYWRVGAGDLSISPSGNHWSISGWIAGNVQNVVYATIVDGAVQYLNGDALPALSPNVLTTIFDAQVADDGTVLWYTQIDEFDPAFRTVVLSNESTLYREGHDEVGGSRAVTLHGRFSPAARYMVATMSSQHSLTLVLVDAEGLPVACGSSPDPYEPNDDCSSATVLDPVNLLPLVRTATASVTRTDDDWYELSVNAGEMLQIRASHTAVHGEVDLEVFEGTCNGLTLVASGAQSTPDETVWVQGPAAGTQTLYLRVFVPNRSAGDCVEYHVQYTSGDVPPCMQSSGVVDDAFEPNDSCSNPTPVQVGTLSDLRVNRSSPDYYTFTIAAGGFATFDITTPASNGVIDLHALSQGCSGIRIAYDSSTSPSVTASNFSSEPAQVFVRVATTATIWSPSCLSYDMTVTAMGDVIGYPLASPMCPGTINSTGQRATLLGYGNNIAAANLFELRANNLPIGATGFFLVSSRTSITTNPGGSQGHLCLGNQIGRILSSVQMSPFGQAAWRVDLSAIPQPSGTVAVVPGSWWYFQMWYRDANPQPTSNFTEAIGVIFH